MTTGLPFEDNANDLTASHAGEKIPALNSLNLNNNTPSGPVRFFLFGVVEVEKTATFFRGIF